MKPQHETALKTTGIELSQETVDERFKEMFARMENLYELETSETSQTELEASRDAILGELLESDPSDAIDYVVRSLALLYEDRTIEYRQGDAVITSFATRETSNQRLDDHFEVIRHDSGAVDIRASCMAFEDMGFTVFRSADGVVSTYTTIGSYNIPAGESTKAPDGSQRVHERILRDFYLQTLSTAGHVLHRRETDPGAAIWADNQAKAMLLTEKGDILQLSKYTSSA